MEAPEERGIKNGFRKDLEPQSLLDNFLHIMKEVNGKVKRQ